MCYAMYYVCMFTAHSECMSSGRHAFFPDLPRPALLCKHLRCNVEAEALDSRNPDVLKA